MRAIVFKQNKSIFFKVSLSVVLGFLLALGDVFSTEITSENTTSMLAIGVKTVCYSMLVLVVASFVYALLKKEDEAKAKNIIFRIKPKRVLRIAAILFAFWSFYYLVFYPGNLFFRDTSFQLSQFYGDPLWGNFSSLPGYQFTDHHPFFDTLVFGLFVYFGEIGFDSQPFGYFLYVFLQGIAMALSLSFSCEYLKSRGLSRRLYFLLVAVYALLPFYPIAAISMTKDSLFTWVYVLFVVEVFEIVRTKGSCLSSGKHLIFLLAVSLLMCLTKKTGIYVVLVVLLLLAMFVLKNKLRIVLPIVLTSVVSFAVLPLLVFPILNVSPGSKVEVLGFFYQQTAQYVIDYPEDISSEEYKIIDSLIGIETLEDRFDPHNIDDIKGWGFDPNVEYWPSNSELIEYIKVYLAQGLRHPDSYIKAVLSLCSGWFNLSSENAVLEKLDYQHLQLEPSDGSLHIERDGRIQAISEKASSALIWMSSIPGLNLLFCQSLWASFLPILLSAFIVKYRRKNWLVILPTVVTFCFLMLCPVSQPTHPETFRYALPLIFTVPLLFGLLMSKAFGVENSEIES